MGTWGPGNFESDTALDTVGSILEGATKEISGFCAEESAAVEDLDIVITAVAIHIALHDHCHALPPEHALTVILRDKVLRTYDEQIDGLEPTPEFKRQRRATIQETLDRYEQLAMKAG